MSAEVDTSTVAAAEAADPVDYEMPDWEKARHAAQAQAARDDIALLLRHVERQEGRVIPTGGAICDRRYQLPAESLGTACP